jgi:hypothetical protein
MSWRRPIPLLFAGGTALVPLVAWARRPVSLSCVVVEAVITAFAVVAAFWLASVGLWLLEHRW